MARWTPKPPPGGRNRFEKPERKVAGKRLDPPSDETGHKITGREITVVYIDDFNEVPLGLSGPTLTNNEPNENEEPMPSLTDKTLAALMEEMERMARGGGGGGPTDFTRLYWGGEMAAPKQHAEDQALQAYRAARQPLERYLHKASAQSTAWEDVIGNEAARTALLEAIEHPVRYAADYAAMGMRQPNGVLLYGPPGCGKTMFAKAAASALARLHGADTELLIINGPEIQSKWFGESEATVRKLFAFARAYRAHKGHPLVLFIDEADALLPPRSQGFSPTSDIVATFLAEMDGMARHGAFVILATNRPDHIDEAVLRDGRIDRRIRVERPTYEAAVAIAGKALAGVPCAPDADADVLIGHLFDPTHLLAPLTNPHSGMVHHFLLQHIVSGAMIVGLVERAKHIALRRVHAQRQQDPGSVLQLEGEDLLSAVLETYAEAKQLTHHGAVREFAETVAIPAEEARKQHHNNLN